VYDGVPFRPVMNKIGHNWKRKENP